MSVRFRRIDTLVHRMADWLCKQEQRGMTVRFQKINTFVHRMADWLCKLDEFPRDEQLEQELMVVRKLRPLALRLLWAILIYR